MTTYLRMLARLSRPSALAIFGLFAVTGLAHAGAADRPLLVAPVLAVVAGFLLFCVLLNDVSDRAVDAVNLAGDRSRPLVTGDASAGDFVLMAAAAGAVALAGAALLSWPAVAVTAAGLAFGAAYSLRPVRIADRGVVAPMLLPLGYVVVPYLVGVLAVRSTVGAADLLLVAALYAGFVGRIVLKDFRDVRGDRLWGKRTFLVRHGRRSTCAFSACSWTAGTVLLAAVEGWSLALAAALAVQLALALGLLRALAHDRGVRRDERLISALALVGRGSVVTLIAHLSMVRAGWSPAAGAAVLAVIALLAAGQAWVMATAGPVAGSRRWRVPAQAGGRLGRSAPRASSDDFGVGEADAWLARTTAA